MLLRISIVLLSGLILSLVSCRDGVVFPEPEIIETSPVVHSPDWNDLTIADLLPGEEVQFQLEGFRVDAPLRTLLFMQNGSQLNVNRFTIEGQIASENPLQLFGTDKTEFSYRFSIKTHLGSNTSSVYTIRLTDESSLTDEIFFTLITRQLSPVQVYAARSDNAARGGNFGGTDLDNGVSTSSTDPDAEIINLGLQGRWQTIMGLNNAELRTTNEDFLSFEYSEFLPFVFDKGISANEISCGR